MWGGGTYNDFSNDTRLTEGTQEEGEEAGEGDDETYLEDQEGKSIVEGVFMLEGAIGGGLHGGGACWRSGSGHLIKKMMR